MNSTKQIVALLLVLQILSAVYLWTGTLLGTLTASGFAIFLGIDLLSFAMVTYVYTHDRWKEPINRVLILIGAAALVVLLVSSLYFA
jgi:RsiW-degrading membrane proteinase PrsW (M82 family)